MSKASSFFPTIKGVRDSNIGSLSSPTDVTNWNHLLLNGTFYMANGRANEPIAGSNWECQVLMGANTDNLTQLATSNKGVYTRSRRNSVWGKWKQLHEAAFHNVGTSNIGRISSEMKFSTYSTNPTYTILDEFVSGDRIIFSKMRKSNTLNVIIDGVGTFYDEDGVNVSNTLTMDSGDAFTLEIVKSGVTNWVFKVY